MCYASKYYLFGTQDRVNNCNVWIQCGTEVSEYNLELDLHRITSNLFIFPKTNLFLKHAIQKSVNMLQIYLKILIYSQVG